MKETIRLLRPKQWIKNLFVIAPIFFGGSMFDWYAVAESVVTFIAFSFAASAVYCLNDIRDIDDDRRHSEKCHRPLPSGTVSVRQACCIMTVMAVAALLTTLLLSPQSRGGVAGVIAAYLILNALYCLKLKQYAIIDVCTIAIGYILRVVAGGIATGIQLSHWLVMMTFLIALFFALAKRRDDVVRMEATGEAPRANTGQYSLTFINDAINIVCAVTMVCYIMYTVSPEVVTRFNCKYLYLTSLLVLLGILRYIQITVVEKRSGDPTKVFYHDHFTQLIAVAWMASFLLIIYFS